MSSARSPAGLPRTYRRPLRGQRCRERGSSRYWLAVRCQLPAGRRHVRHPSRRRSSASPNAMRRDTAGSATSHRPRRRAFSTMRSRLSLRQQSARGSRWCWAPNGSSMATSRRPRWSSTNKAACSAFRTRCRSDPAEDSTYTPGCERRVFRVGALSFGVVICHEGWRYPETVRFAAVRGAQAVFQPHWAEYEGGIRPTTFAEPANSFHEKAMLCRAAENTIYFASVNCAAAGSPTTSAVVDPDGVLLVAQPYGEPGLLFADLELAKATGYLASRCKPTRG